MLSLETAWSLKSYYKAQVSRHFLKEKGARSHVFGAHASQKQVCLLWCDCEKGRIGLLFSILLFNHVCYWQELLFASTFGPCNGDRNRNWTRCKAGTWISIIARVWCSNTRSTVHSPCEHMGCILVYIRCGRIDICARKHSYSMGYWRDQLWPY
jgi:hypothetical protein